MKEESKKKKSIKKKMLILLAIFLSPAASIALSFLRLIVKLMYIFLCAAAFIALYHISDSFVKLPDYNGVDKETLADMILIEKQFNTWGDGPILVIFGDGRIYSFYESGGDMDEKRFSEDYEYRKEYILEHWKLEPIRVSRRDLKRIIQYTPNIERYDRQIIYEWYGGYTLFAEIYDHDCQRITLLGTYGSYIQLNTSPNAKSLLKLVYKYDMMLSYYYGIIREDVPPHYQYSRRYKHYKLLEE